jgi:hypothetical protein
MFGRRSPKTNGAGFGNGRMIPMTTQEPLSGHQIQAIQKQMLTEFQRALDDVELRKIAIDHASRVCTSAAVGIIPPEKVVTLAREMHKFLSEGAAGLAGK